MIQIEQYGFDEEVEMIVQPFEQFIDYNLTKINQNSNQYHYLPRLYSVKFSKKYFIPAENPILINFKPVRNEGNSVLKSPMG